VVGPQWHVAVTTPGGERLARDAVNADAAETGVVAFLPMDTPREVITTSRRTGRVLSRRSIPVVLMAGYLFVHFDPRAQGWRRLYRTPGIERLLGLNPMRPDAIEGGFIAGLMLTASKQGVVPDALPKLVELGATVEALGHSWKQGSKGQQHDAPRVLVRIAIGGLALDAWVPGDTFAALRGGDR
jgi:hypothetical protein